MSISASECAGQANLPLFTSEVPENREYCAKSSRTTPSMRLLVRRQIVFARWGKNIDHETASWSGRRSVERVRRRHVAITHAQLSGFTVDRHDDGAFDDRTCLLVWMLVEWNFGARIDTDEVQHQVRPRRGPHGDAWQWLQAAHGVDICPDSWFWHVAIWHWTCSRCVRGSFVVGDCR